MKYKKIIIAPGPKFLPEENDIVCGVRNANEEYISQGKPEALFFAGFDSDGYAILIGRYEEELDLSTFLIEEMIPYENHINYVMLTLDEVKQIVHSRRKDFSYFSRSAAERLLEEELTKDAEGIQFPTLTELYKILDGKLDH